MQHYSTMDHFEAPSADIPTLIFLVCVTATFGLCGWSFHKLMQPTILPNPGMATYKAPGRAAIHLPVLDLSVDESERAAIAAADAENAQQQIHPLQALVSAEPAPTEVRLPMPALSKSTGHHREHTSSDPGRPWQFAQQWHSGSRNRNAQPMWTRQESD